MSTQNQYPKLHNAMWPGLVGKDFSFAEEFLHHAGKFAFALLRKYPKFL